MVHIFGNLVVLAVISKNNLIVLKGEYADEDELYGENILRERIIYGGFCFFNEGSPLKMLHPQED